MVKADILRYLQIQIAAGKRRKGTQAVPIDLPVLDEIVEWLTRDTSWPDQLTFRAGGILMFDHYTNLDAADPKRTLDRAAAVEWIAKEAERYHPKGAAT